MLLQLESWSELEEQPRRLESVARDIAQPKATVDAIVRAALARIEGAFSKRQTANLVGLVAWRSVSAALAAATWAPAKACRFRPSRRSAANR